MDGAQAAKIAAEIENIINDPATILAWSLSIKINY
jgi:hypothetical protein